MIFDPFENRLCRDIRNQLSQNFLTAIQTKDTSIFLSAASTQKQKTLDPSQINYIDDRIKRYKMVLGQMDPLDQSNTGPDTAYPIARLLWDQHLFFECHEWLEPFWIEASGPEKKALQAIIRAAGAHVLFESNRLSGAEKSAQKAIALLQEYKAQIPALFKPNQLIQTLKNLTFPPVL